MSKSAAADVVLHHLFRCCCKIRADCIFFKSQSFVHDSFYVRPAQVSIVDVLAQAFSTAVRGKSPHKTLQNLEQIKTIPILRCKQILLVLYSHAQIECLLERERVPSAFLGKEHMRVELTSGLVFEQKWKTALLPSNGNILFTTNHDGLISSTCL